VWFAAEHVFVDTREARIQVIMQSLEALETQVHSHPEDADAIRRLSRAYATWILSEGTPIPGRIEAALADSSNPDLLAGTAQALQRQYDEALQKGRPNLRLKKLSERYFERAKLINPKLDLE
jgi:hypothetical protein